MCRFQKVVPSNATILVPHCYRDDAAVAVETSVIVPQTVKTIKQVPQVSMRKGGIRKVQTIWYQQSLGSCSSSDLGQGRWREVEKQMRIVWAMVSRHIIIDLATLLSILVCKTFPTLQSQKHLLDHLLGVINIAPQLRELGADNLSILKIMMGSLWGQMTTSSIFSICRYNRKMQNPSNEKPVIKVPNK